MSNQVKNNRIQTLEPSKLSESIKSKNQDEKLLNTYENYYKTYSGSSQNVNDAVHRQIFTKTQQIYEVSHPSQSETKVIKNADKLNQLKKQYEILKNMKIDDSIIYQQKVSKKQMSSAEPSQNNSVRSVHTNAKEQHHQRNNGLIEYEKKQLELMLGNSMNKIEQLLKAEVEYKRRIYELSRLNPESSDNKLQQKLKVAYTAEKSNEQKIEKLKLEEQKLRNLHFNLTQRIRSVQIENFNLETENRRMGEQKRKLHQNLLMQKQAHMNTKIEIKRYQLEKDMIEKEKSNQVERLKRTIKDMTTDIERLNEKNRKYESSISNLNERINGLNRELALETMKRQNSQKSQKSISRVKEYNEGGKRSQEKNESGDNFQKKLLAKIIELQKAQQLQAKKQIGSLKEEIQNMKFQQDDKAEKNHLQLRITALEKTINEDNEEKMGFLQQLRRIIKDFQDLQMENDDLKDKIRRLQRQINLERQNSAFQMDRLEKSHRIASSVLNSDDINNYLTKIRRLESQNRDLRTKLLKMQDSFSNSESRIQQKMREYSRKLEQSQMQVEKLQKQNDFNLHIAQSKYKAQIQLSRNEAARATKQKSDQKQRLQQYRNSVSQTIQSLKRDQQRALSSYKQKLQQKQSQLEQFLKKSEQQKTRQKLQHEKQLFSLLGRLEQLIKSNQRYVMQNSRLLANESNLYDLRVRMRRLMGLNESVDHLWQVKEIQYFNINALLKEIRGGEEERGE